MNPLPDAAVVDASVAIKWVVGEPDSARAARLLEIRLCAPDLIFAECANILWKKVVREELSAAEAVAAASTLEAADIEMVGTRRLMAKAVGWAIRLGHPAYDCVYLAVAELRDLPLITADERLVGAIRRINGRTARARLLRLRDLD